MSNHTDALRDGDGVTIVNRLRVEAAPEAVFDYLTDLYRELEWNESLESVEAITDGELRPGSQFRVRFGAPVGESVISYDALDRPFSWRTRSSGKLLAVRLVGEITRNGRASEVALQTTLKPRGWLRLIRPVVVRTMARAWDKHLAGMKLALEAPAGEA